MQTVLIDQFETEDLGRTMPACANIEVTAELHEKMFYAFSSADVWTKDGWLITAVQSDKITHHVRKGKVAGRAILSRDTKLYHKPLRKELQAEVKQYKDWLESNK